MNKINKKHREKSRRKYMENPQKPLEKQPETNNFTQNPGDVDHSSVKSGRWETWNDSVFIEVDLTCELWREYDFGGRVYRIENPTKLYFKKTGDTNRVLDREGVIHMLPMPGKNGCVVRCKHRPGMQNVIF